MNVLDRDMFATKLLSLSDDTSLWLPYWRSNCLYQDFLHVDRTISAQEYVQSEHWVKLTCQRCDPGRSISQIQGGELAVRS